MNPRIYSGPSERPTRLTELGLNEIILLQSIQRGQAASASCTLNHPKFYPGLAAWAETVAALREQLIPLGWKRRDEGNLPLTINASENIAITVSTGDEATGQRDGSPCTKSGKGPRTADAVTANALQMKLFGEIRLQPEDLESVNGQMTWILLFHRDARAQEIRAELSRPVKMDVDGHVDGWIERIVLGSMPLGSNPVRLPGDVPQTPNIVIEVKRKRA
jgi:hypothetical protein